MRKLACVVVVAVLAGAPGTAMAWNPVKAIGDKLAAAARAVGGALGLPFGGFVSSLSAPTIQNVEDAGHRLIADANQSIGQQVDHVGSVTAGLIKATDEVVAKQLDSVNQDLASRIVQVKTSVDSSVDHAFDRIDATIGRVDVDIAQRIEQVHKDAKDVVADVGATARGVLDSANKLLAARIDDVGRIANASIAQADAAAKARIAQLDQVAATRIENLDVVASKQTLGLEGTLLRLAALIAWLAFTAFVMWRLFREAADAFEKIGPGHRFNAKQFASRFAPQVALSSVFGLGLFLASGMLSKLPAQRLAALQTQHRDAFGAAVDKLDLPSARNELAQLEVLGIEEPAQVQIEQLAEIEHDLFTRPGRLQSVAGVQEIADELGRQKAGNADVDVLEAFVTWQVGGTRADEYEAASLCYAALAGKPRPELAQLARHYIALFLHDPYPRPAGATGPTDAQLAASAKGDAVPLELAHAAEYDDLVLALDTASAPAYLDMIDAQARLEVAIAAKTDPTSARDTRNAAAKQVIAAWQAFDHGLEAAPSLGGDPTVLAAFTLDDAVLSHAKFYAAQPAATTLAPALMGRDPKAACDAKCALLRAQMAPLRVEWGRRYRALLGARASDVVAYEESQRFAIYEQRVTAFEQAYVAYAKAKAAHAGDLATRAATAARLAADLELYRGTTTEAAWIVNDAGVSVPDDPAIAQAYAIRRLRLL